MQVVLPELDGRLLTTAISFKAEESEVAGLEFARVAHQPASEGIAAAARSASLWARLATTPRAERKLALVLSDYPGAAGQAAHAVGLDAIASTAEILQLLDCEGFDVGERFPTMRASSPRFAMPSLRRSSRSPTTSACSRNSIRKPAPRSSPPGARLTTIPPSATVTSPCALRATAD